MSRREPAESDPGHCRDAVVGRRARPAARDVGGSGDRGPAALTGAAVTGAAVDGAAFDRALVGTRTTLVRDDGVEVDLDARRWRRTACGEDRWMLDRCEGPVIDLGCGPGRLVAALAGRGIPALGVDVSAVAQRLCRRRRTPMVRGDVFGPLPGEETWQHVLLADGNIGIGGDPLRLLERAARLLRPGGTVLVETDAGPDVLWQGTARVRTAAGTGEPLPWACAGADALVRLVATLGLHRTADYRGTRSFVQFTAPPPGTAPAVAAAG